MTTKYRQTKIGMIPKTWEVQTVGDLFDIVTGTTPSTKQSGYWDEGSINWITPTDLSKLSNEVYVDKSERKITETALKENNLTVMPEGSIIISTRAPVGYVAVLRESACFNQGCKGLIPRGSAEICAEFYCYYLRSQRYMLENSSGGSTFKELSKKRLQAFEVVFPPSVEQQRIAEILACADDAIQLADSAIARCEKLKNDLTHHLLTKGIGHRECKQTPLGRIPKEWTPVKLDDYACIKGRIGWRGLKASEYTETGPYLVANKHIANGRVLWDACDHLSEFRYEESPEIKLEANDIIMAKDGSIGNAAFIDHLPDKATINSTIMLIRITDSNLLPEFMFYFLQGPHFLRFKYQKTAGTSIPHIFQRDMKELRIPLLHKSEQAKIVAILSSFDEKLQINRKRRVKLERIKNGLMNDLLTGRRRVKVVV